MKPPTYGLAVNYSEALYASIQLAKRMEKIEALLSKPNPRMAEALRREHEALRGLRERLEVILAEHNAKVLAGLRQLADDEKPCTCGAPERC